MATTSSQNPPVPFNGYNPPQARPNIGTGRSASTRSRRMSVGGEADLAAQNYGHIPPMAPAAPEAPKGLPVSYPNGTMPGHANPQYRSNISRSFSTRSRTRPRESTYVPENVGYEDYGRAPPSEKMGYQQRPPIQRAPASQPTFVNAPPAMTNSSQPPQFIDQAQESQGSGEMLPQPTSRSHAPLSRSNTVQSTKGDRRSLPVDRSPLQQLETRFVGLSKEEKRARMMEAEKKLREKNARRDSQRTSAVPQPAPVDSNSEPRESPRNIERPSTGPSTPYSGSPRNPRNQPQRRQPSVNGKPAPPGQPQHAIGQEGPRNAISPPTQRQPIQSQQNPRPYGVGDPATGHVVQPAQYQQRDVQTQGISDAPRATAGKPRPGSIQGQRPIRPDYDQQRPTTSAGRQPLTATQNNRPVTSYNEQTFSDTGVRPTHFAGEALNKDVEQQQQQPDEAHESLPPVLKKTKRQTVSFDVPPPTPPPLDDWRRAPVARLRLTDHDFERVDVDKGKAWWEKSASSNRRQSRALPADYRKPTPKVNERNRFNPLLFLKCGPLLRYLGIRKTKVDGPLGPTEQQVWRGSVMIVTTDSLSSLETPPTLRLFSQPMDLLPPPPREIGGDEEAHLAPEYVDPTAGLVKVGRDGRALYVKPVEHLEEAVDLSAVESEDGLFESSPSPIDYTAEKNSGSNSIPSSRLHPVNGENSGMYEEIQGFRLYSDPARDVTFWRFNIEVELTDKQERIAYRINEGPATGFWVPAKGQSMNIMFHSCNGFSLSVDRDKFSGPDPLWRDVLNEHQTRPFHVMIGGGDQIYCDKVMHESDLFEEWTRLKNPQTKHNAPFSAAMKAELETFYLNHYADWFSHGLFGLANSQIPMVNIWDDHDIIDGFGSYPDHLMRSPVFSGLGNVAFKYYMLFQHQSVPEETEADEPSWLLGADMGPYIKEKSRSLFMSLGSGVSFLGIDCRTERMRDEIVSEHTYDLIWDRCYREIERGEVKHLIVLLGIPIAYPRLSANTPLTYQVWLENLLTSRAMDPVKALSRAGVFSNLTNRFDGSVEVLDDVDDHWTAKHHKTERTLLIEDLQDLAAEKSVRVTILSGDVHLAAIGQFYSNPTLNISKDKDYRYMPNVISSAIVNAPPSEMMADFLNKRNKLHHMDSNTDEDMIPIFTHDVDGKSRNNKRLLPRRNWCSIREYHPGTTPPPTPPTPAESPNEDADADDARPGLLRRTLSLGRGENRAPSQGRPAGLLRRLSNRAHPPTREFNLENAQQRRRFSTDAAPAAANRRPLESGDSYFAPATNDEPQPGRFHRRATDLSTKSANKKANAEDGADDTFVNLEGGLDITLNLEVNPKDPAGITTPYRLLVPALWYDGGYDPEPHRVVKGWKKWLGRGKPKKGGPELHDQGDYSGQPRDGDVYDEEEDHEDYDDDDEYYGTQTHDADYVPHGELDSDDESYTPPKRKKWLGIV